MLPASAKITIRLVLDWTGQLLIFAGFAGLVYIGFLWASAVDPTLGWAFLAVAAVGAGAALRRAAKL